jgi:hypothetical protein
MASLVTLRGELILSVVILVDGVEVGVAFRRHLMANWTIALGVPAGDTLATGVRTSQLRSVAEVYFVTRGLRAGGAR